MATTALSTAPAIFVTTYAAYNSGRQFERGQWVDLTHFGDYTEFVDHCKEVYDNEQDPEFMVTDFENFPRAWYSESGLPSESIYDCIVGYSQMSDTDAFDAYMDIFGHSNGESEWDDLKSDFEDRYRGEYKSDTDFADEYAEETGMLDGVPETVKCYFDYEAFARDLLSSDFCEQDGHYFWNC